MIRHIYKLCSIAEPTQFMRNSFKKAFGKYLLATNIISSGVLLGAGDLVQQEIEYRRKILSKRYDYQRLGRMFAVGLATGPLHHYFYKYLDQLYPKSDLTTVGKKILIDQFVASPLFIYSFFFGMGILERKNLKECHDEIKTSFMTVYMVDWLVWPPTQFVNFYYIPAKYRVLYINFITMIYDVFLSYVKHDKHEAKSKVQIATQ